MKRLTTGSDIGSLLIGNKDFTFTVSNKYGDCENKILIFESEQEYQNYLIKKYGELKWFCIFKYVGKVTGKFNLYKYDCGVDYANDNDIVYKFNGTYRIYLKDDAYCDFPIFAFVKTE